MVTVDCAVTGICVLDFTPFCITMSVTVYMKLSGMLVVRILSCCKDMTGVSYPTIYTHTHTLILLSQGTITDTNKYTQYLTTKCAVMRTCLSRYDSHGASPLQMHFKHITSLSKLVTTCHRQPQPGGNQSHYFNLTLVTYCMAKSVRGMLKGIMCAKMACCVSYNR